MEVRAGREEGVKSGEGRGEMEMSAVLGEEGEEEEVKRRRDGDAC